MNRQELHALLTAAEIDPRAFDVLGSDPDPIPGDLYVLRYLRMRHSARSYCWATYYSERGGRRNLRRFASEDEACRHLLAEIASDPSTER